MLSNRRLKIKLFFLIYLTIILIQYFSYLFMGLEAYPALIFPAFAYAGQSQVIEVPKYKIKVTFKDNSTQELDLKILLKHISSSQGTTVFWILAEDKNFLKAYPKSKTLGLLSNEQFIGQEKPPYQEQEFKKWLKDIIKAKTKRDDLISLIFIEEKAVYTKNRNPQYIKTITIEKTKINFN